MTIKFECGNCGKQLSTSDDKAGKTGKCPDCGERVTVPQPASAIEEDDPFDFGELAATLPPLSVGRSSRPGRSCPMCGARVSATDRSCPACGEELESVSTGQGGPGSVERRGEVSIGNRIDVGAVFSVGWRRFQDQMGIAMATVLVAGFMNIGFATILELALQGLGETEAQIIQQLVSFVFNTWLYLGVYQFLLSIARGERARLEQIFWGGRFFLRGIFVKILYGIVLLIGVGPLVGICYWLAAEAKQEMIALIIAIPTAIWAIYLGLSLFWAEYVLIDTDCDSISSLKTSWELMTGNYLAVFVLLILGGILIFVGLMMCCVGAIFTAPLAMIVQAVTYDHLTGGARRRPGDRY